MRLSRTSRLMETNESQYWIPDQNTPDAMRRAGEEREYRLKGTTEGVNQ